MNSTENQRFLEHQASGMKTEIILDLENDTRQTLTNYDVDSISQMHVYDEAGNRHKLCDIYSEFKTIFVFVRVIFFSYLYWVDTKVMRNFFISLHPKKGAQYLVVCKGSNILGATPGKNHSKRH